MGWLAGETLIGARLDVSSHCVSARCGNLSAAQISRGRAALIPGRQFVSFLTLLESARLHHSVGTLIMQIYTEDPPLAETLHGTSPSRQPSSTQLFV